MADEVLPQFRFWLGDGPNEPVTADQVIAVFSEEFLASLVQASGLDQGAVVEALAEKLPAFVDSVLPEGRIDQGLVQSRSLNLGLAGHPDDRTPAETAKMPVGHHGKPAAHQVHHRHSTRE